MALAYRTTPATSQTSGSASSITVTKQTGTAVGDIIFIYAFGINTATPTAPTGFTATTVDSNNESCLFYRVATGSEASTFTVTGGGSAPMEAIIATVSGSSGTVTVGTQGSSGGSLSVVVPSITMPGTGWALVFVGEEDGYGSVGAAITPPSGYTSQVTNGAQTANATVMLADNESAASGATGTKTFTCAASYPYWAGIQVGIVAASATNITESDVAGQVDTLAVTAADAVADVAAGLDAPTATASVPLPDAAGAVDALSLTSIGISQADAAGAVESVSVTASGAAADVAGGVEAVSVGTVSLSLPDVAGAADRLTATVTDSVPDAAGAADSIAVSSTGAAVPDVGGAVDAIVAVVTVAVSDAAGQVDSVSTSGSESASVPDAAGGVDKAAVTAAAGPADAAGQVDSVSAVVTVALADVAGGAEAASSGASVSVSDAAGAADQSVTGQSAAVPDSAGATDAATAHASAALPDLAGADDSISVSEYASISAGDTAGADDSIAVAVTGEQTHAGDVAGGRDALSIYKAGVVTAYALSVGSACDVYLGLALSAAIRCDVGGVYQAGMRSLATDRWLPMYPYSKGAL